MKTKQKIKEFPKSLSSDGAYEQIPFDSPISKKEERQALQFSYSRTAITHDCKIFFDLQARATSEIAVADLNDSENR